jgi:hypothetical protein
MFGRFTLEIELGNAAMQTREDVGDALFRLAVTLTQTSRLEGIVKDLNGNTVGVWDLTEEPAEVAK